jgi:hypothetical protein
MFSEKSIMFKPSPTIEASSYDAIQLSGAMKVLQYLHRSQVVLDVHKDQPVIGNARIKPFYMNRSDPVDLGLWQIDRPDDIPVRLQTRPTNEGTECVMTIMDDQHQTHEVDAVLAAGIIDYLARVSVDPSFVALSAGTR